MKNKMEIRKMTKALLATRVFSFLFFFFFCCCINKHKRLLKEKGRQNKFSPTAFMSSSSFCLHFRLIELSESSSVFFALINYMHTGPMVSRWTEKAVWIIYTPAIIHEEHFMETHNGIIIIYIFVLSMYKLSKSK
jgi:hypothetical protein